jgi:hypothetical protein
VPVYSFSIRDGDGSNREVLGFIDLLNDYAALAFGNDVIRDMLRDNADQYVGWMMDIAEGERDVCSVAFPRAFTCISTAQEGGRRKSLVRFGAHARALQPHLQAMTPCATAPPLVGGVLQGSERTVQASRARCAHRRSLACVASWQLQDRRFVNCRHRTT